MKLTTRCLVWVACLLLCGSALLADHVPPSKIAVGKPEHILAGVNVYDDTIGAIIKRLGKPDHFSATTNPDYPPGSGERSYEWNRDGVRLRVGTEFRTDATTKKVIESAPLLVDVWGKRPGNLGNTGRGLPLGADFATIQKVYGSRSQKNPYAVTLQWKDETTLVIDLNKEGRIVHMQLLAAVE
jgi:hypothetical protein